MNNFHDFCFPLNRFKSFGLLRNIFAFKVSLAGDFDFSHDLEMEIATEDPYSLAAACELGEKSGEGFLGMHCVAANFLPDIPLSTPTDGDKFEIIFVIDRSGMICLYHGFICLLFLSQICYGL